MTLNTGLRLQGGGASATSTGATVFTGNISGPGMFAIANGRAVFSGNYSNTGGFLIGDGGFTAKVSFTGTGSGTGSMLISSSFGGPTNPTTMSYTNGGLRPARSWSGTPPRVLEPQIIPLNNSTINNQVRWASVPNRAKKATPSSTWCGGITATWAGPLSWGSRRLTKIGSGQLNLGNVSDTYTGGTTVNGGTLTANRLGRAPSPSPAASLRSPRRAPQQRRGHDRRSGSSLRQGRLDLTNNSLVIDYRARSGRGERYQGADPEATRLRSSAGDATTELGYGDNACWARRRWRRAVDT